LPAKIDLIGHRLGELAEHDNVGDIRQRGMMVGIELVASRRTGQALDPQKLTGAAVCLAARKQGLIIRPLGDVVVLMPAPAMDIDTLERMLDITIETIRLESLAGANGIQRVESLAVQAGAMRGIVPEALRWGGHRGGGCETGIGDCPRRGKV